MTTLAVKQSALSWFLNPHLMRTATIDSLHRMTPRYQWRNPVMFVVYIGSILTTILWIQSLVGTGEAPAGFILAITVWLWATLLFANFAEAIAEGRSKAQAASLKSARKDTIAKKLARPERDSASTPTPSSHLRKGDVVLVEEGDLVPGDGEVIVGAASINESAVTGESAPVIRAAGSDFNTVTGGTMVLSDWIVVRVSVNPGEAFLDRMIGMVEGAKRQKTPNEIALMILLVAMTLVFLLATVTLLPFSIYSVDVAKAGTPVSITVLVALLVCLIPTTIGGLLSAIGVTGMGRMMRANVIATSGRAVEAAGDCDVLLLDKTGTITFGNRQASSLHAVAGVTQHQLAESTLLASLGDETPEGKSIVALTKRSFGIVPPPLEPGQFTIIPFSAQTRMSGVTYRGREIRKGALDAIRAFSSRKGNTIDHEVMTRVEDVAHARRHAARRRGRQACSASSS
jgi:K+-transporting ATPase ATPase B chain